MDGLLTAAQTGVAGIPRRDAEILLAAAAKLTRTALLTRSRETLPADAIAQFEDWRRRRAAGEPVAYLLGRREFWSLDLEVGAAVLVPRPETELLVERVLERVTAPSAQIADLGTGSGAIAIALAVERPAWRISASDNSPAALAVARRNGERLAPGRIEWLMNDAEGWFAPLAGRRFDAIASNPPYIAADDPVLEGEGLRFEPRGALTPGGDGYAALATLINGAPGHLEPGGWLLLEHGATQGFAVRAALVARGFTSVTSHRDLAGHERMSEAQWPSL
ncbi:MAG: peptide chain release factor N(5)-glutamine methyltransferase [Steroidobacteraceae bacterium]|nr:peptide chain release factor N(5)-glutamine methyltransferase [Steroidobacteraceae bacterium]